MDSYRFLILPQTLNKIPKFYQIFFEVLKLTRVQKTNFFCKYNNYSTSGIISASPAVFPQWGLGLQMLWMQLDGHPQSITPRHMNQSQNRIKMSDAKNVQNSRSASKTNGQVLNDQKSILQKCFIYKIIQRKYTLLILFLENIYKFYYEVYQHCKIQYHKYYLIFYPLDLTESYFISSKFSIYIFICVYVYIYIYIYTYICVCMCVHICIWKISVLRYHKTHFCE